MTPIDISVALLMVSVVVACLVWFHGSLAAGSTRLFLAMMKRLGLGSGTAALYDPRVKATLKKARRRCGRCPGEGLCERSLAGEVEGDNAFCVNARTFATLTKA